MGGAEGLSTFSQGEGLSPSRTGRRRCSFSLTLKVCLRSPFPAAGGFTAHHSARGVPVKWRPKATRGAEGRAAGAIWRRGRKPLPCLALVDAGGAVACELHGIGECRGRPPLAR